MPSQAMSSKKASKHPGLYPSKGQYPIFSSRTRAQDQFSNLSLSAGKTLP